MAPSPAASRASAKAVVSWARSNRLHSRATLTEIKLLRFRMNTLFASHRIASHRIALCFAGEPPCTRTSTAPWTAARRNSLPCGGRARYSRRCRCAGTNRYRCWPKQQCRAGHRHRRRDRHHRRPARTWFRPKSTIRVHSRNRFRCASRRPHLRPQLLPPRSTRQILDRACRTPAKVTT